MVCVCVYLYINILSKSFKSFQPICLAKFSQVRSISCTAESDGRALLKAHIEGAKQVALNFLICLTAVFCFISTFFISSLEASNRQRLPGK